ncbi:bifunctional uridylate/adenylate kinase [Exophiala xenobiotica]|uniref:Uridylate kinase n=1 Tax=Lithohypha guttulata TaxID=1690604 RepID=A0ABR0KNQ3_9EURO|nr:bifunctional uridylate/adenylate kinase [Lithohypha guttulata]KAK5329207.1 bifunctional uridylate/adenylate kinase [Exophiala xenobiotica]
MPAVPQIDPTSGAAPEVQPSIPLASTNVTPAFDPANVLVVYILGGPGSGKGTQSTHLVQDYGFKHLSAGDLLREEQDRQGSEYGQMIKDYIKDGKIVPMEVTVKLLQNAMQAELDSGKKTRFLIDGFPRKMDQAVYFEQSVCPSQCTIFLDCPEDVMLKRLLNRGKTSGRSDDNEESIKKRFRTFVETSMPVVDMFEKEDKVVKADATGSQNDVYERLVGQLAQRNIHPVK